MAWPTLQTASQAAAAIEHLQAHPMDGRRLWMVPCRSNVDSLLQLPQAAAEGRRALAAAQAAAQQGVRPRAASAERRSPAAAHDVLAPVRLQQYRLGAAAGEAPLRASWALIGKQVFVSGLPPGTPRHDISQLFRDAGGTGEMTTNLQAVSLTAAALRVTAEPRLPGLHRS